MENGGTVFKLGTCYNAINCDSRKIVLVLKDLLVEISWRKFLFLEGECVRRLTSPGGHWPFQPKSIRINEH